MRIGQELLYLSRADVEATGVSLAEVEAAVEGVFADKAAGRVVTVPKTGFQPSEESAHFISMPGSLRSPALAVHKWVGLSSGNAARGLPHLGGLIVLSELASGMPVAVMDGTWITAVRTGAVTAVAARRLARADSARIGFVGSGVQARSSLEALRRNFPIRDVRAFGVPDGHARAFAREAEAQGLAARVAEAPRHAVEGMDIVVTTVPASPGLEPFLSADWLAPGAFASLVDLGRSWRAEGFDTFDRMVTDDHQQTARLAADHSLPYGGPFHAELAELVCGSKPGRQSASERAVFLHPGLALPDMAVAAVVFEGAKARHLGTMLPL